MYCNIIGKDFTNFAFTNKSVRSLMNNSLYRWNAMYSFNFVDKGNFVDIGNHMSHLRLNVPVCVLSE